MRKNLKVAIVENDVIIATDMKHTLTKGGFAVTGLYRSGEELLKNVTGIDTDIIVMDVSLRGKIDGIETAEIISMLVEIPVIFTSGYSQKEIMDKIRYSDAYGFLSKPFSADELLMTVKLGYTNFISANKRKVNIKNVGYNLQNVFSRSTSSITRYAEFLADNIDELSISEIKQYASKINVYLKAVQELADEKSMVKKIRK